MRWQSASAITLEVDMVDITLDSMQQLLLAHCSASAAM